jgi:hypothetical protein
MANIDVDVTEIETYKGGLLHSYKDKPALVVYGKKQEWYKDGKLHRDTIDAKGIVNPAAIYDSGFKAWYKNGRCYKTEGFLDVNINESSGASGSKDVDRVSGVSKSRRFWLCGL